MGAGNVAYQALTTTVCVGPMKLMIKKQLGEKTFFPSFLKLNRRITHFDGNKNVKKNSVMYTLRLENCFAR